MMLNALLVKEIGEPDELEAFFLQALYWSIGGALLEDGRAKFDTYAKYLASANMLQDEGAAAGPGMACLAHVKHTSLSACPLFFQNGMYSRTPVYQSMSDQLSFAICFLMHQTLYIKKNQCGFQKERGTIDMVFAARQLQEKCQEQHVDLFSTYVDLTKAFNREGQ